LILIWLLITPPACIFGYFVRGGMKGVSIVLFGMIVVAFVVGNLVIVTDVSENVSQDILEHAAKDRIQDALKNNWTNTAVIAALMFSMVSSYGFPLDPDAHLREFNGGKRIEQYFGYQVNEVVQYYFFLFSCISFVEYIVAMMLASIHLMWTEALSMEDMELYYKDNRMAPAAPLVWLFCGAFWHMLSTAILYYYYHYEIGWSFGLLLLLGVVYLAKEMRAVSKWEPAWKRLARVSIRARTLSSSITAMKGVSALKSKQVSPEIPTENPSIESEQVSPHEASAGPAWEDNFSGQPVPSEKTPQKAPRKKRGPLR
jgi:hypothetical protein